MKIATSIITIFESETIPVLTDGIYRGEEVDGYLPLDELIEFVGALPSTVQVERQPGLVRLRLTNPECLPVILRHWRLLLEAAVEAARHAAQMKERFSEGGKIELQTGAPNEVLKQ